MNSEHYEAFASEAKRHGQLKSLEKMFSNDTTYTVYDKIQLLEKHRTIILSAPAGSGATYFVSQLASESPKETLYLCPDKRRLDGLKNEYKHIASGCDLPIYFFGGFYIEESNFMRKTLIGNGTKIKNVIIDETTFHRDGRNKSIDLFKTYEALLSIIDNSTFIYIVR